MLEDANKAMYLAVPKLSRLSNVTRIGYPIIQRNDKISKYKDYIGDYVEASDTSFLAIGFCIL